jgi:TrmH family RNA methyltransferase
MAALRPTRIVLVRPRNPSNIGACARAMANFGVTDLVVVDPYEPVWQETRSAPEAESVVLAARAVGSFEEAIEGCGVIVGTSSFHRRPIEHAVVELPNLNRYLASFPASTPLALILGSERSGLSNEELARCQIVVKIPTKPATPSMNLGQALAVFLYELRREGWEPAVPAAAAPPEEREDLVKLWQALGEATDYPPGFTAEARLGRIRAALKDAVLPPATVRYLLSFSRWLQKKLADGRQPTADKKPADSEQPTVDSSGHLL